MGGAWTMPGHSKIWLGNMQRGLFCRGLDEAPNKQMQGLGFLFGVQGLGCRGARSGKEFEKTTCKNGDCRHKKFQKKIGFRVYLDPPM